MTLAPKKFSAGEIIRLEVDSSSVVGDLVRQDVTIDNRVKVATDNLESDPIIGVISKKLSATLAEVTLRGILDVPAGSRGRVFLSDSGTFTTSAPTVNFLQRLGYNFGNGKLHFEPNSMVTLLR